MENVTELLFTGFGVIITILGISTYLVQRPGKYRQHIIKSLASKGYTLVSIKAPKPFQTGPFPKFEIKIQPISTNAFGVSGEKTTYGIVTYKNESGVEKESWVKIETVAFRVDSIDWKPEL